MRGGWIERRYICYVLKKFENLGDVNRIYPPEVSQKIRWGIAYLQPKTDARELFSILHQCQNFRP